MRWAVIFFVLFVFGFNSGFVLYAQENEDLAQQVAGTAEDTVAQEPTKAEDTSEEPIPEKTEDEAVDTEDTVAQEKEAKPTEEKSKEEPTDAEDTAAQEPTKAEDTSEEPTPEKTEDEAVDTKETTTQEPTKTEDAAEEPKQEESDTEETPVPKIDTVSLQEPKGNWLLKRYWWTEAERQYEKIKQIVHGILESCTSFTTIRNELERTVCDPFYRTVGISQGELQVTINNLIEQLEEERHEGDLSHDERKLLETIQAEKETIEELQKEVDSIVTMEEGTVE